MQTILGSVIFTQTYINIQQVKYIA